MPRKRNRSRYLTLDEIKALPPETACFIDFETDSLGTHWVERKTAVDREDISNPAIIIAPTGRPAKHLREQYGVAEHAALCMGFDIPRYMLELIAAHDAMERSTTIHELVYGRGAGPGKTIHYGGKVGGSMLSGSEASHAIIDDPDGEERRWAPFDGWADPYILELKKMKDADSFRKLYLQEFTPPDPEQMTPAERKAAHRETYLKHNRTRGQRHHRYDRY